MLIFAMTALVLAPAKTELVYVRHGETVANATGVYNSRTLNVFSKVGEKGVEDLTDRLLQERPFDSILVSPSPRALRTIAPYLEARGLKARIWPYAYECCTGRRPRGVKETKVTYSTRITLPGDVDDLFIIEKGRDRLPNNTSFGAGLAQVSDAVRDFRARFRGKRVLIVAHSGFGGEFLYRLTGKRYQVLNTKEMRFSLP